MGRSADEDRAMSSGARLLMTVSLCALAAGCAYRPAPDVGTLNPTFLDDLEIWLFDGEQPLAPL